MWDGGRDRAVALNIYTASHAGIVQNIFSFSSSSITKLQTNQLRRVRVFIILLYRDCQFRNSKKLMFDVCYNLESFDIYWQPTLLYTLQQGQFDRNTNSVLVKWSELALPRPPAGPSLWDKHILNSPISTLYQIAEERGNWPAWSGRMSYIFTRNNHNNGKVDVISNINIYISFISKMHIVIGYNKYMSHC